VKPLIKYGVDFRTFDEKIHFVRSNRFLRVQASLSVKVTVCGISFPPAVCSMPDLNQLSPFWQGLVGGLIANALFAIVLSVTPLVARFAWSRKQDSLLLLSAFIFFYVGLLAIRFNTVVHVAATISASGGLGTSVKVIPPKLNP
jgi:hypothetical protein